MKKMIPIFVYLIIWIMSVIVFCFFTSGSDGLGYSVIFLWIILPATTFLVSLLIGRNDFWGKRKWISPLFFGLMYMLAEYSTFSMANNIAFGKLNVPEWKMIIAGTVISVIGMALGLLSGRKAGRS